MDTVHHNKRGQWIFAILLVVAGSMIYFNYRQQVFEVLASGTQWVLVTCGFVPEGDENIQSERLRKLYYAARMYKETPAKELSPEDQLAAERYPGMGFGLTRTFDSRPVSTVIGGWLFAIPCTYFVDSRDCNKTLTTARLKVNVDNFEPISFETIEQFLSVRSPDLLRMTIGNIGSWPQRNTQSNIQGDANNNNRSVAPQDGYYRYEPLETESNSDEFVCTDTQWASERGLMDHCLLRFNYGKDSVVELKFSSSYRADSERIKRDALGLVSSFQVRQ